MNVRFPDPARHRRLAACWLLLGTLGVAGAATAQTKDTLGQPPPVSLPPASSPEVVLNLLKLLVKQHVITQQAADGLIHQAQEEAAASHTAAASAPVLVAAPPAAASPPGSVHVQYVPEIVKQQLRDEVKQEVLQTAKAENWAQPNALPDWISRIKIIGDFKLRYESDMYGSNNYNGLIDFNTINSGSGYDISSNNSSLPPILNTSEDRERLRVRGRFGVDVNIDEDVSAEVRLSTGTISNPISPNQTLGADFNKYNITADRVFLNYRPTDEISIYAGRFDNPFFTSELIWYDEIGLDGGAVIAKPSTGTNIAPFAIVGAFPIENTTLDFPSTSEVKVASRDKWLYAAQLGADWQATHDLGFKLGVSDYYYQNIQGEESSPCIVLTSTDSCDTDLTRPGFLTKGNTLFALRDIVPTVGNTVTSEPEYFGLASGFNVLDVRAQADIKATDAIHVVLDGDYAINTAFNRSKIEALSPVNTYSGSIGNEAFMMGVTVGYPHVVERGDWSFSASYKYVESDSVLDAFTDPDFHLGGTNAKGYVLIGNLGLAHNVWLQPRWFSATEISGPPLAIDVLEVDLNARF